MCVGVSFSLTVNAEEVLKEVLKTSSLCSGSGRTGKRPLFSSASVSLSCQPQDWLLFTLGLELEESIRASFGHTPNHFRVLSTCSK